MGRRPPGLPQSAGAREQPRRQRASRAVLDGAEAFADIYGSEARERRLSSGASAVDGPGSAAAASRRRPAADGRDGARASPAVCGRRGVSGRDI